MRTIFEKTMANKLRNDGLMYSQIGDIMKLSKNSVKSLCTYKAKANKKKTGPKNKISKFNSLSIKRTICTKLKIFQKITSSVLIKECSLIANVRTVQKYLKNVGYNYKKAKKQIVLTKKHKEMRTQLITTWFVNEINFNKIVFSDEKRFCLDGPDDWRSYAPKSCNIIRQKRQCGGGGIMLWMMLMPNGLLAYRVIKGKFNSDSYIDLLKTMIIPMIKINFGSDVMYQEDNCSVHKAKKVKDFIRNTGLNVLDWPAKSPDLNIVEDVWLIISNKVYDGHPFQNNYELLKKLSEVILFLNNNQRDVLINLYGQIRERMCKVLKKNGNLYNKPSS